MSKDLDWNNQKIAELLRSIAAAYQIENEAKNRFRIVAYQRAADAIEHLSSEIKDIWDEGKLDEIPGVGSSIASNLDELFHTGKSQHFDSLMKHMPKAMFQLMEVPGIGPKKAYRLATEFKLSSRKPLNDLKKIAQSGKVALMSGFGEESERDILQGLEEYANRSKRILLPTAEAVAEDVIAWLKKSPYINQMDPLGSLRRKASTIGDVDIAVGTDHPLEVIAHFVKYPNATRIIEKGEHTSSVLVPGDIQVDLMVQPVEAYGALLQHFTGSKHHNIALREYALKKKLSLSEYGIKNLKTKNPKYLKFESEEKFYNYLGLEWIPPEIREGTGEIAAALHFAQGKPKGLPKLVELKDIKGDLQIHSDFDIETSHDLGISSMEDIVSKANELGYEYIAFTEHNPSRSKHTPTEVVNILKRKQEVVAKLNNKLVKSVKTRVRKIFNSLEIDIRPNGELPINETGLDTLDFGLVSIHSSFRLSRTEQTNRVLRAVEYPNIKIFAHPTGRMLNRREGIELDWEKIFSACLEKNIWLEINAEPSRLDLPDFLVREAVKYGVKFTLGTDSHQTESLNNMKFGVSVARRGWLTKNDIINSLSLEKFQAKLNTTRRR